YANVGAATAAEVLGEFLVALGVHRGDLPAGAHDRGRWFRTLTQGRSLAIFLDDIRVPAQVRELLPGPGGSIVVVTGLGFGFESLRDIAEVIDIDPVGHEMAVA